MELRVKAKPKEWIITVVALVMICFAANSNVSALPKLIAHLVLGK